MLSTPLSETVSEFLNEATRCNQRRLLVLAGPRDWGISVLRKILLELPFERKIVFTWQKDFEVPAEIEELKNVDAYLGTTYEFLAMDVHHSFIPNDLGKLVSIVKGGGFVVLLTPKFDEWIQSTNFFHEVILTPPYTLNDIRHNFVKWVIKKLMEHKGIAIVNPEGVVKYSKVKCEKYRRTVTVPENAKFPRQIYEMCLTQDQIRVLQMGESLEKRGVMVITADRGRGKSSALGMLAGSLAGKVRRICVTAPDMNNLNEFFRFLEKTLQIRGINYKRRRKSVMGKKFSIEYVEPASIVPHRYDMIFVDEAAGIPVPLLLKYLKSRRVVYSTTTHGYEGTGRSFSIRFMGALKKSGRNYITVEMTEPIRYARNDPVERWLFDTLLLDSEPVQLQSVEPERTVYRKYAIEDLLDNESKLREYYGIFVLAHYRNNPNDFGILCDAPNQELRVLEYEGHIVCSVQLAKEGGIEDYAEDLYYGETPPGNIIPDVIIKHYRMRDFAKYKGYRIVRIATHPEFMDMGLGTEMLRNIKKEPVDWVGSSFGATARLLRFWLKNGFYPVHISPKINEVTGEYSVIVLHPVKSSVKRKMKNIRKMFGKKFIASLGEIHRDLDLDIARLLLSTLPRDETLKLTDTEWRRLVAYCWGPGNYEVTMDVIKKVAEQYFFLRNPPELTEEQEKILIGKVLQHRHWDDVGREIRRGGTYVVIELREIMRKFLGDEYEEEISEFQRRFHSADSERR